MNGSRCVSSLEARRIPQPGKRVDTERRLESTPSRRTLHRVGRPAGSRATFHSAAGSRMRSSHTPVQTDGTVGESLRPTRAWLLRRSTSRSKRACTLTRRRSRASRGSGCCDEQGSLHPRRRFQQRSHSEVPGGCSERAESELVRSGPSCDINHEPIEPPPFALPHWVPRVRAGRLDMGTRPWALGRGTGDRCPQQRERGAQALRAGPKLCAEVPAGAEHREFGSAVPLDRVVAPSPVRAGCSGAPTHRKPGRTRKSPPGDPGGLAGPETGASSGPVAAPPEPSTSAGRWR